jgi:Lyase
VEKDLLGEKTLPADAYYGVQTARALENFQISGVNTNHYPGFWEAWAIVKLAAARANADVGAMPKEKLAMIEKACQAVRAGKYQDQFHTDWYQGGAGTSPLRGLVGVAAYGQNDFYSSRFAAPRATERDHDEPQDHPGRNAFRRAVAGSPSGAAGGPCHRDLRIEGGRTGSTAPPTPRPGGARARHRRRQLSAG